MGSMTTPISTAARQVATVVRDRINRGGERLWRFADFGDLPFVAVAQILSRLARGGDVERLSKGLYYRSRETTFGRSRPNPAAIRTLAAQQGTVFPSGVAAANLLGFTTQAPRRAEVATSAQSLPRKLMGDDTVIHTRRPAAWAGMSQADAALLDFLRRGGKTSELSPQATVKRTLALCAERGRFARLLAVAATEPPRVRAMLGAIGEQLGKSAKALRPLRASLNPLSTFDFGLLSRLACARAWQAKVQRRA